METTFDIWRVWMVNTSVVAVAWFDKLESALSLILLVFSIWWTILKLIKAYRDFHNGVDDPPKGDEKC